MEAGTEDRRSRNWAVRESWFLGVPRKEQEEELKDEENSSNVEAKASFALRDFPDGNEEKQAESNSSSSDSDSSSDSSSRSDGATKGIKNKKRSKKHKQQPKKDEEQGEKKPSHSFCAWFSDDLRRPDLAWVKAVFFFQSASLVALYPYLTIHMRSLGFSAEDAAVVNAALPAADVFGPPVAGMLADKIGNFRIFMSIVTFLNGAGSLLLLAVPPVPAEEVSQDLCCIEAGFGGPFQCRQVNWTPRQYNASLQSTLLPETSDFLTLPNCIQMNTEEESEEHRERRPREVQHFPLNSKISAGGTSPPCGHGSDLMRCRVIGDGGEDNSGGWHKSFWTYLTVRVLLDLLRASSLMLFEGAVVAIIKEQGGDYGLQKLFGTAGAVIFGPLAGKVIDWGGGDYSSIFYLYFALRAATSLLVLKLRLDFKPPAKKVFTQALCVLRRYEVWTFLLAFGSCGLMWGFLETYLFWYLEDLGATKLLMGVSLAVGTLAGLPLTLFSRWLLSKLGHAAVAASALALYAVRCLGYSFMPSAEYAVILEIAKPWCSTLVLIAAFSFVKSSSPLSTSATVEGVFGALYFGVGRGLGGLCGGFAVDAAGARTSFRAFAAAALGAAGAYAAAHAAGVACARKVRRGSGRSSAAAAEGVEV